MSLKEIAFAVLTMLSIKNVHGQVPTQTVRGVVTERSINIPLAGTTIQFIDLENLKVISDSMGRFRILHVPVGRHSLRLSHVGFKPIVLNNLSVESGKELILTIELEEDAAVNAEIKIQGRTNKSRAINDMAMVSARMFSVEETRRFAAGLNDPSRMATAFAGVSGGGDGNALVIRGNAPNGLLWRMEGVNIPNPNHFARVGTSGGAISILSAQLLANSDFMTGAFPAEYGNALSGVFDIKLRKGNSEKREHTLSLSTIGLDAATEGYFKKGYGGSYLVNYRYGFLTLMQKIGFKIGDAATSFQDLSFNIHLPTKKMGSVAFFGFGGLSEQNNEPIGDSIIWTNNSSKRSGWLDAANTGVLGVSHTINISKKTLLKTIYSINNYTYKEEDSRIEKANGPVVFSRKNKFNENDGILSVVLTHKFDKRHLVKAGVYSTGKHFSLKQRETVSNVLKDKILNDGETRLTNYFVQTKWDPSRRLSFQVGFQGQYFTLNNKSVIEPRMGLRFMTGSNQYLTFGYGNHAQVQPLGNYFARIKVGSDTILANKNLDFSRSKHFVLGYSIQPFPNWNLKSELYYQWLYQIPITSGKPTSYTVINLEDDYAIEPLNNNGKGQNYGLEITLQRYWNDQFYLLSTLSLYQSTFLPSDNVWRSTRYNSNSSTTFLIGKEWNIKRKKPTSIGLDAKMIYAGGVRVTPIDLSKSIVQKRTVLDNTRIYEEKLNPFFRLDIQMEWKVQYKKITGSAILGVQNATNKKNAVRQSFDVASGKIRYSYLLGLIPVFGYKVDL
jgi:hypothetical protein